MSVVEVTKVFQGRNVFEILGQLHQLLVMVTVLVSLSERADLGMVKTRKEKTQVIG